MLVRVSSASIWSTPFTRSLLRKLDAKTFRGDVSEKIQVHHASLTIQVGLSCVGTLQNRCSRFRSTGPKDFVFSNARTGVNIDSIKTGWRNACEKAGLVNLRFHDTRHTFATRLRANGVHEWDIRDLLGHASVRMTSVYTHQTPANLCKAGLCTKSPKSHPRQWVDWFRSVLKKYS